MEPPEPMVPKTEACISLYQALVDEAARGMDGGSKGEARG